MAGAQATSAAAATVDSAAVVVDGRTVAEVRGVAGKPAAERAAEIEARIVAAARDTALRPVDLKVVETGLASQIQWGDRVIKAIIGKKVPPVTIMHGGIVLTIEVWRSVLAAGVKGMEFDPGTKLWIESQADLEAAE